MKIGVVIPLKAQKISKDWDEVSASVCRTLNSVLNQSSKEYSVVVVGHDKPLLLAEKAHNSEDIFVHFDDSPPPVTDHDEMSNQLKYERDRCSKILKGLIHLKNANRGITHWFALDADDLLHQDFVKTLSNIEKADAYLIENGYFYFEHSRVFNKTDEFYIYCGSSAVISDKYFNLPAKVEEENFRYMPFGNISHVHMKQYFIDNKIDFKVPDKRLLVYVRENGDNISDGYVDSFVKKLKLKLGMHARRRFLSKKEKASFLID